MIVPELVSTVASSIENDWRIAVALGRCSSLVVRHKVFCRVDGFSEASCCHFNFQLTISPSKMIRALSSCWRSCKRSCLSYLNWESRALGDNIGIDHSVSAAFHWALVPSDLLELSRVFSPLLFGCVGRNVDSMLLICCQARCSPINVPLHRHFLFHFKQLVPHYLVILLVL